MPGVARPSENLPVGHCSHDHSGQRPRTGLQRVLHTTWLLGPLSEPGESLSRWGLVQTANISFPCFYLCKTAIFYFMLEAFLLFCESVVKLVVNQMNTVKQGILYWTCTGLAVEVIGLVPTCD